jgi:hypothetical protein
MSPATSVASARAERSNNAYRPRTNEDDRALAVVAPAICLGRPPLSFGLRRQKITDSRKPVAVPRPYADALASCARYWSSYSRW